jgi:prolyl oligopeptidase
VAAGFTLLYFAAPPTTRRDNVRETLHGVVIADPYRWLEDQNSAETRAWIAAQNRYTRSVLDPLPGRQRLRERLTELLRVEETGMPIERGGRYFFLRRSPGQDQAVLSMRSGHNGRDEVLVDPNLLSPDHSVSVALLDVSQDGKLLAYGVRRGGEDETTVTLYNVDRRMNAHDGLPRGRYSGVSIAPGGRAIYYSRLEPEGARVYVHAIGKGGPDR